MTPELAKAIAHELAIELSESIQQNQEGAPELPISTLADVLGLGAWLVVALSPYFKAGGPTEFHLQLQRLSKTFEIGRMEAEEFEEHLFKRIVDGLESPDRLRSEIHFVLAMLTSPVRLHEVLNEATAEFLPPRGPGTPPLIPRGAEPILATRSATLLPAAERFLQLHQLFPAKKSEEIIDIMSSDYLQEASALAQRISTLRKTLEDTEYVGLKTGSSRTQYVADALAGADFQISPTYAHQRAEQGRKLLNESLKAEK